MATPLPKELWEAIVAQLPSPGPKYANVITFVKDDEKDRMYTVRVSRGVSMEERNTIMYMRIRIRPDTSAGERCDHLETDSIVQQAIMLGWIFHADADRDAYVGRRRFFCMRKA